MSSRSAPPLASLGPHDVGSVALSCPSDITWLSDRVYAHWERQVHALLVLLIKNGSMTADMLRLAIESLEPEVYASLSYYERWAAAMTSILIRAGKISRAEIEEAMGHVPATSDVLFQRGDCVRICPESMNKRWRRPHLRAPGYVHGATGTVLSCTGIFNDPSYAAFGESAPPQPLYRVALDAKTVWGAACEEWEGAEGDGLVVDVFQPWLEPSAAAAAAADDNAVTADAAAADDDDDAVTSVAAPASADYHHAHHHHDGTQHHHDGHPHVHADRLTTERAAIDKEPAEMPLEPLARALLQVCVSRDLCSLAAIASVIDAQDTAVSNGYGAQLVARAWVDEAFEQRLLQDAPAAARELGIETSNYVSGSSTSVRSSTTQHASGTTILQVVKNDASTHNLIVCTLCSCYPAAVLGLSPDWYKSCHYRSMAVRAPRQLLRQFGLHVPAGTRVVTHDSTAEMRYMVLPMRPRGTDGWSEAQLRPLVTRDCMIGTQLPIAPS
jgi:nitrile hydratase subunit alpha